jgi:hypothetical protein
MPADGIRAASKSGVRHVPMAALAIDYITLAFARKGVPGSQDASDVPHSGRYGANADVKQAGLCKPIHAHAALPSLSVVAEYARPLRATARESRRRMRKALP